MYIINPVICLIQHGSSLSVSVSSNLNLKHLFSYSAAYLCDVLQVKETSDSSNESNILSRLGLMSRPLWENTRVTGVELATAQESLITQNKLSRVLLIYVKARMLKTKVKAKLDTHKAKTNLALRPRINIRGYNVPVSRS